MPRSYVPLGVMIALCGLAACRGQRASSGGERQLCPISADTVGPAPWLLTSDQTSAAGRLAESLVVWTRADYVDSRQLEVALQHLKRSDPLIGAVVVGRAIRTASSISPHGAANLALARLLAQEMRSGRLRFDEVVERHWYPSSVDERTVIAAALREAGSDSNVVRASESVACWELDRVAYAFFPSRALVLADLNVESGPLVLAVENLTRGGAPGQAALARILQYASANSGLTAFVHRAIALARAGERR